MKDEKFIKQVLEDAEKEVKLYETLLAKIINETPQYTYEIAKYSLRLSIATERERILSWILRE